MRFDPFNIFNLSSLRGLNWFEGLKRIKVFFQWLWGAPATLVGVFLLFSLVSFYERLGIILVVGLPLLGFELAFRAIVWIVAGFLESEGDRSRKFIEAAQSQSPDEIKKKIIKWVSEIKKIKTHQICWAIFFPIWFFCWYKMVVNSSLSPLSHWKESGITFPNQKPIFYKKLQNANDQIANELKIVWMMICAITLTLFKGLSCLMILFLGYHLYLSIEAGVLLVLKERRRPPP
jgi:hypothetical protein